MEKLFLFQPWETVRWRGRRRGHQGTILSTSSGLLYPYGLGTRALGLQEEAEVACKHQAALLEPCAHQLVPVARRIHNLPQKAPQPRDRLLKYMSLLGTVHSQTTAEGCGRGEKEGWRQETSREED